MAVKSKETLKTQSSETFYDNDLGGITPADHRQFNEDLIDSMATVAQGNKADTAIQGVRVSGSFLPTTTVGGKNIVDWSNGPATAAQGKKADTAIQAATIGGAAVTKSGTTLQLPAYPAEVEDAAFTKATLSGSTSGVSGAIYFGVVGHAFLLCGTYKSTIMGSISGVTIANIPTAYLNRMILPVHIALPVVPKDTTQRPYLVTMKVTKTTSTLSLQVINLSNDILGDSKELVIDSLIIPLS